MPQRGYFPGLDVVRFYAAVCVVVMHLAQVPGWAIGRNVQLSPLLTLPFISGYDSVTLFFVLSGFLITYLLLTEREATGAISVRGFYWRRILRVWPVYFLTLALSLLVLTLVGDAGAAGPLWTDKLLLFIVMLPNLALSLTLPTIVNPFWSIGVEEQFYLVWPWLVRLARTPRRLWVLFAGIMVVRFLLIAILPFFLMTQLGWFLDSLRLDALVLGGAGALLLHSQSPMLEVFYHRLTQSLSLIGFVVIVLLRDMPTRPPVYHFVIACIFLVLILNIGTNPNSILKLDRFRRVAELGRITYGLYMYHTLVLYVILKLLVPVADPWFTPLFVVTGMSASIGFSLLSYRFFETPFLRLKKRLGRRPEPLPEVSLSNPVPRGEG